MYMYLLSCNTVAMGSERGTISGYSVKKKELGSVTSGMLAGRMGMLVDDYYYEHLCH